MASSMIHISVANELNKTLKKDRKPFLIGSIAPDIAKQVGLNKKASHFQETNESLPDLDKFLSLYKNDLNDDFVLEYYVHLYTDYLWFKYFEPDFYQNGVIYKLDGTKEVVEKSKKRDYFYNDYTNLNIKLIDEYNLDLSIFYEEIPKFKNIIKEIPMDKIKVIVDQAGIIIENSKENKPYLFDMKIINKFINTSTEYILSNLKDIGVI